jgi:hypothetical protein
MGTFEYVRVSEAFHWKIQFISFDCEPRIILESAVLRGALAPVVPYREITCDQFSTGYWDCIHELLDTERRPGKFEECRTAGELEIARSIRRLLGDGEPRYCDLRPIERFLSLEIVILAILMYVIAK